MAHPIDQVQLAFNESGLMALNIVLGLIMFGVSLDLSLDDFKRAIRSPKGPIIGVIAQFFVMPALTFLLIMLINPPPSVALGMIMVASCPGGNVSNFITHTGKGDTALSVTMTALSTTGAIIMTPFNVTFWGSMRPDTAAILKNFSMEPMQMLSTVFILLGIPLVLGMLVAAKLPKVAEALKKPFKILSLVFFAAFVIVAFRTNFSHFLANIGYVFLPVLLQNALSLGTGYGLAALARLPVEQRRAVCIEVGIQNSGMGLVLIFGFFGGFGGMAVIAAWWGIWHIIAGLSLAGFWVKILPRFQKPPADTEAAT